MPPTSVIEQALISLVPAFNVLPPELIQLATALLAQSRAKAATLKPEEEIGRTYACAHLACERLKSHLKLDKLKPTPPVAPRVYKKLYTYLEQVLATSTPKTTRHIDADKRASSSRAASTAATPQSRRRTPATGKTTKQVLESAELAAQDATPSHRASKRKRDDVNTAAGLPVQGQAVRPLEVSDLLDGAGDVDADVIMNDAQPVSDEEDATILLVTTPKHKRPAKTPLHRKEKHAPRPAFDDEESEGECPAGLRPGLGTMFQDSLDWLNADRAEDHAEWRRSILSRCKAAPRRQSRSAVAVTT